jgi:hypothetical protein
MVQLTFMQRCNTRQLITMATRNCVISELPAQSYIKISRRGCTMKSSEAVNNANLSRCPTFRRLYLSPSSGVYVVSLTPPTFPLTVPAVTAEMKLYGINTTFRHSSQYSPHVEAGSNTSTVALRVVGGDEKGTQRLGV